QGGDRGGDGGAERGRHRLSDSVRHAQGNRSHHGHRRHRGADEDRRQVGWLEPVGQMISFDEAVELVRSTAAPLGTESVPLDQAAGRVLAAPVVARIDSPRSDVSAMDGYALREADLATLPARLRVIGESFAGGGWDCAISPGEFVRIFTGAPMPGGAEEHTSELQSRE